MKEVTAADFVAAFDAGRVLTTVEMGSLGPGYEQAIQVLTVEIVRDYLGKPFPSTGEEWESFGRETVRRVETALGGLTGAQFGAAQWLAARYLRKGWAATIEECKELKGHRIISFSRAFPNAAVIPHAYAAIIVPIPIPESMEAVTDTLTVDDLRRVLMAATVRADALDRETCDNSMYSSDTRARLTAEWKDLTKSCVRLVAAIPTGDAMARASSEFLASRHST